MSDDEQVQKMPKALKDPSGAEPEGGSVPEEPQGAENQPKPVAAMDEHGSDQAAGDEVEEASEEEDAIESDESDVAESGEDAAGTATKTEPEQKPQVAPSAKFEPKAEAAKAEAPKQVAAEATEPAPAKKPQQQPKGEKGKGKKDQGKEQGKEKEMPDDFKYIVRIANTDLSGHRTVEWGLTGIKGIGIRLATIITDRSGIPRNKKIGMLSDEEIEMLENQVKNIANDLPKWLVNHRKEFISGQNMHIFSTEVELTLRDDINRMKMIRCYRGIRHEQGQKVRGQRTRSNGRTGMTVGVMKKIVKQQQAATATEEK